MKDNEPEQQTEVQRVEGIFARGFVIAGGLFWAIAAFAGPFVYQETGLAASMKTAMWPFLAAVVILVIGWTYERLAAVLLFGAAAAVPVWGVLYNWEIGVWLVMSVVLIVPMVLAGVLFILSAGPETRPSLAEEPRLLPETTAVNMPRKGGVQPRPH